MSTVNPINSGKKSNRDLVGSLLETEVQAAKAFFAGCGSRRAQPGKCQSQRVSTQWSAGLVDLPDHAVKPRVFHRPDSPVPA